MKKEKKLYQYLCNMCCGERLLAILATNQREAKRIAMNIDSKIHIIRRIEGTRTFRECYYQKQIDYAREALKEKRYTIKDLGDL